MSAKRGEKIRTEECASNVFRFHPSEGGEIYVIRSDDGLVLVDSGLGKYRNALIGAMEEAALPPEDVRLAFVSHFHCDHVGDIGWWQEHYGVPVAAHSEAVEPMRLPDLTITGSYIPYAGFDEPFVPCNIKYPLKDDEEFQIGDKKFVVENAPGHTVSGIHVICENVIFVGDNLFGSGGIGWMDAHWGSNPEDYVKTLRRLRNHCGKLALPGHGPPFTLTEDVIEKGIEKVSFYIPLEHGLGFPRASTQYGKKDK